MSSRASVMSPPFVGVVIRVCVMVECLSGRLKQVRHTAMYLSVPPINSTWKTIEGGIEVWMGKEFCYWTPLHKGHF